MPSSPSAPSPPSDGRPRSFRATLLAMIGLSLLNIIQALDQTIVSTALPTIVAELKGFELYAWVATSYLLTSVITVPIFGRLGDYYGRKYFVLAAVALFTLSSALCGMAPGMLFLVLARALQGVAGGMVVGTLFACIPDLFPDAAQRVRWQSMFACAFALANAFGPTLGGFLTEYYSWRLVFYVNLPIGVLCMWFIWRYMPHIRHQRGDAPARIDWQGAALIAAALGGLQLLVEMMPRHGASPGMVALGAASVFAFAALVWWEKRCPHGLLPVEMFANAVLSRMFVLSLLAGCIMFVLLIYTPLLMQGGFGLSPNQAGMLVTPLALSIPAGSMVSARIMLRLPNPVAILYGGFGLIALSGLGVVSMTASTAHGLVALYVTGCGFGLGCVMPNLSIFCQEAAGRAHLGIATATSQSLRMVGGMLGTAAVGTLVNHTYVRHLRERLGGNAAQSAARPLNDPQILVNHEAQGRFLAAAHGAGAQWLDVARGALVAAIHSGQFMALLLTLAALWTIKGTPAMKLTRLRKPAKGAGRP